MADNFHSWNKECLWKSTHNQWEIGFMLTGGLAANHLLAISQLTSQLQINEQLSENRKLQAMLASALTANDRLQVKVKALNGSKSLHLNVSVALLSKTEQAYIRARLLLFVSYNYSQLECWFWACHVSDSSAQSWIVCVILFPLSSQDKITIFISILYDFRHLWSRISLQSDLNDARISSIVGKNEEMATALIQVRLLL